MTVASFIEINARQSPSAALCWLAPPLKGAFVQERNVRRLDGTQEPDEHLAHAFEQLRQLVQDLAAAQILDIVGDHLDAQHTSALVIDLQRQISPLDLEHGQVIALRLHGLDHLIGRASPLCYLVRAMREAENGLDLLQIQRRASTVDHLLVHLVHRCSTQEQEIATELQLKHRVLVGKADALLFLMGERKAKAGGEDPSLAKFAQATDGVLLMQSCRHTVDRGKITALDKAVADLDGGQALAAGLTFNPLVAVQDQLRTERGIAAHADRHMTPFAIHDVKVVMLDERPVLAVADFCNLPSGIAFDLPDRRRRIPR